MNSSYTGLPLSATIPGNPQVLLSLADQIQVLGSGLAGAQSELADIVAGQWIGRAADAFQLVIQKQPQRYGVAGDAFSAAAAALRSYAGALENSQALARQALATLESSQSLSQANASAEAIQLAATQNIAAYNSAMGRALIDAETAVAALVSALLDVTSQAPKQPSLLQDLIHGAGELPKYFWSFQTALFNADVQFVEGFWSSTGGALWMLGKGLVELDLSLNPIRLLVDPEGWWHSVTHDGSTLLKITTAIGRNPLGFVKEVGLSLVDAKDFEHDPAKWLGNITGTVLLTVVTFGGGDAVAGATKGAEAVSEVSTTLDATTAVATVTDTSEEAASVASKFNDLQHTAATAGRDLVSGTKDNLADKIKAVHDLTSGTGGSALEKINGGLKDVISNYKDSLQEAFHPEGAKGLDVNNAVKVYVDTHYTAKFDDLGESLNGALKSLRQGETLSKGDLDSILQSFQAGNKIAGRVQTTVTAGNVVEANSP